jgi:hypothetical protein
MTQLRIEQTFGRIGIEQTRGSMRMQVLPADFKITQKPAVVRIEKDWPAVQIDWRATRASMGYKDIVPFQKDVARKGRSAALSGIQRIAREGDRLGRIEAGGNPIPDIAEAAAWPAKDFNIALMPDRPPVISAAGRLDIKIMPGDVSVDSTTRFPQISGQGGTIDVYVKVKPSIKIEVVGRQIDLLG